MEAKVLAFTLTGIMPLLMHRDDIDASTRLNKWRKDPKNRGKSVAGDDRSPPWTWRTYCYGEGELDTVSMASEVVMRAIRNGAAQISMKGQKTFKEASQSGMMIDSEYCDFYCNGKQIKFAPFVAIEDEDFDVQADAVRDSGFKLFAKRAKIGQAKHIRVRPRFDNWQVKGHIKVFNDMLKVDLVGDMLRLAGNGGIGDWRPSCKSPGSFGMFTAEVETVK